MENCGNVKIAISIIILSSSLRFWCRKAGMKGATLLSPEVWFSVKKDEARPLVVFNAFSSLQCFDTDG